jgi:enamine deaminase RidA (YjgF/YER057c/UK114 family)
MPVRRISSGSEFEKIAGYSRVVVDDRYAHVSGTTGFDYATMTIADDVVEQTHQAFRNVSRALADTGLNLDDVVRVRCYLADRADFAKVAPLFGEYFARARPANTTVIATLVDPRMKIEIEVTARGAF